MKLLTVDTELRDILDRIVLLKIDLIILNILVSLNCA